MYHYV
jgi:hypothetical protein